mgnify:CR=1 FL=1
MVNSTSFSTLSLLERMKVERICSTDDPLDSLEHHINHSTSGSSIYMNPTFRPDKSILINAPNYNEYIDALEISVSFKINSFDDLCEALQKRIDFFHKQGCRISDHGLEYIPFQSATLSEIKKIYIKKRKGANLESKEIEKFQTAILIFLCKQYHKLGWVQQFHLGAMRNNNSRMLKKLGPEGELVALVAQGALVISEACGEVGAVFARTGDQAANSMERGAAVAQAVASTLTAIGQIMQQNSQVQISEMDKQIQSEKNRDGKSKESLGKIKAMEAKKEAMKKKAFEQNKKIENISRKIAKYIPPQINDALFSTHRGHGHYLAKGGNLTKLLLELFGDKNGCCAGLGGSMHVADLEKNIVGSNGIVGAGVPIACGHAMGQKMSRINGISVVFFALNNFLSNLIVS